jgi:hypothetical protein
VEGTFQWIEEEEEGTTRRKSNYPTTGCYYQFWGRVGTGYRSRYAKCREGRGICAVFPITRQKKATIRRSSVPSSVGARKRPTYVRYGMYVCMKRSDARIPEL